MQKKYSTEDKAVLAFRKKQLSAWIARQEQLFGKVKAAAEQEEDVADALLLEELTQWIRRALAFGNLYLSLMDIDKHEQKEVEKKIGLNHKEIHHAHQAAMEQQAILLMQAEENGYHF